MGGFILFLLLIFAVVLFMGIGFIMRFVRIFTKGPGTSASGRRYSDNRNRYQDRNNDSGNDSSSSHHKIFGKDEGEYVDFEEIK